MTTPKQPTWTDAERSIVQDAYARCDGTHRAAWAIIGDSLPGRTFMAVQNKAAELGVSLGHQRNWGGARTSVLLEPPPMLPYGSPPGPCAKCGAGAHVQDRTPEGDYECVICGEPQYVAAKVREGRG